MNMSVPRGSQQGSVIYVGISTNLEQVGGRVTTPRLCSCWQQRGYVLVSPQCRSMHLRGLGLLRRRPEEDLVFDLTSSDPIPSV